METNRVIIDMKTEPTEALKALSQCVFDVYDTEGEDIENIVHYAEAKDIAMKSFKEGQSSPKIKQLEWDFYGTYYSAETPVFDYLITQEGDFIENDDNCALYVTGFPILHGTLEEAQAAAQADFERRVKECLDL